MKRGMDMKMEKLWKGLCLVGIGLFLSMHTFTLKNPELNAAEVSPQDAITCGTTCTLSIIYDKNKGTLFDQVNANLNLATEDISKKRIEHMYIFPKSSSDILSHAEWVRVRDDFLNNNIYIDSNTGKNYMVDVDYLYMNGVKIENDTLPDEAFLNMSFQKLELPAITTLTKNALKGVRFKDIYLPTTLLNADAEALPLNDVGFNLQYVHVKGDLSVLTKCLEKPRNTGIYVDTTLLTNVEQAILKNVRPI